MKTAIRAASPPSRRSRQLLLYNARLCTFTAAPTVGLLVSRMPRLLSVSRNPRLLATRNDALALAGFTVVSPRSPEQTLLLLQQEEFDAVIIGHSVEPELRRQLIESIRKAKPGLPIAFVFMPGEDPGEEPQADFVVDISHGPMPLLQALRDHLDAKGQGNSG